MATQPKRRTLRLADGGVFHIGPGTVSVPVSTVPLDPPAVVLHINRSCGALELEPGAIAAMRGGRAEPPVALPPTFKSTARHVTAWRQERFPFSISDEAAGYPGKLASNANETLWVKRANGACLLERQHPEPEGSKIANFEWVDISARDAVAWLADNGYRAVPATLLRRARNGGTDERPRRNTRR
jgi:hypothetical protein